MLVTIHSSRPIGGSITAPPSKSMAHRAVLCAALATGSSHITHLEFSMFQDEKHSEIELFQ